MAHEKMKLSDILKELASEAEGFKLSLDNGAAVIRIKDIAKASLGTSKSGRHHVAGTKSYIKLEIDGVRYDLNMHLLRHGAKVEKKEESPVKRLTIG